MSYITDTHNPDNWPSESELAEDARLDSLPKMHGPLTEADAAALDEIEREVARAFDEMYPQSSEPTDHPF